MVSKDEMKKSKTGILWKLVRENKEIIFRKKLEQKTGQLKNNQLVKKTKKELARILTEINSRVD